MPRKPKGGTDEKLSEIRRTYIEGEMELVELSKERTGDVDGYSYAYLRRLASGKHENWSGLRAEFRDRQKEFSEEIVKKGVDYLIKSSPTYSAIIDATESIKRQVEMSKGFQGSCAYHLKRVHSALKNKPQEDIDRMPIDTLVKMLNTLVRAAAYAAAMERAALGIEQPLISLTQNNLNVDTGIDLKTLSDEELRRLASGQ